MALLYHACTVCQVHKCFCIPYFFKTNRTLGCVQFCLRHLRDRLRWQYQRVFAAFFQGVRQYELQTAGLVAEKLFVFYANPVSFCIVVTAVIFLWSEVYARIARVTRDT